MRLCAGASPSTAVHHLRRVQQPQPTHKHPLAGLWAEECADGSGIEMVRVVYDFSGSSARIVATKVGASGGCCCDSKKGTGWKEGSGLQLLLQPVRCQMPYRLPGLSSSSLYCSTPIAAMTSQEALKK